MRALVSRFSALLVVHKRFTVFIKQIIGLLNKQNPHTRAGLCVCAASEPAKNVYAVYSLLRQLFWCRYLLNSTH